jgi:hypothetical protein
VTCRFVSRKKVANHEFGERLKVFGKETRGKNAQTQIKTLLLYV